MMKLGTRAIIRVDGMNPRTISVKADDGSHFNRIEYGVSALSNDFNEEVMFKAALEDARTPDDVLKAAKRYYRHRNAVANVRLVTDY